jgi:hypothetical protein
MDQNNTCQKEHEARVLRDNEQLKRDITICIVDIRDIVIELEQSINCTRKQIDPADGEKDSDSCPGYAPISQVEEIKKLVHNAIAKINAISSESGHTKGSSEAESNQ